MGGLCAREGGLLDLCTTASEREWRLQARERERFRSAVMAWRNGGDSAAVDTAPAPAANNEGGKLLEGKYDEVRTHTMRFVDTVARVRLAVWVRVRVRVTVKVRVRVRVT